MINDERLNEYRVSGILIRVIRDNDEKNDVKGNVVAWDSEVVMIRKRNRKMVKLSREYIYQPYENERVSLEP
ncbi:hypothetical protein [Chengkuizengella sediminis]|uniref:hypothetical protein n=1 Tax=Chengkuizengella sediminis TaxID=1885917 RepID=UPI001389D9FE|nr:hypothetical protein [Chengkuizengella sediminis]NDI36454.1 hypothetical protein [Chengkuizengella sediminis]